MRKIVLAGALASLISWPAAGSAQIAVEVTGGVGYTFVDAVDWLRSGVFNPASLAYGGSGQVVFGEGRREERLGLQVGLEAGLQHLLAYDITIDGNTIRGNATALRLLGFIRFWLPGKAWFGEFAVGPFLFDGFTDPSLNVGLGTILGSGRVQFPVKIRGSLLFDREGLVFPVSLQSGVSFRVKN